MKDAVVIGAGGHGREVAEILADGPNFRPIGFIDQDPQLTGRTIDDLPVLGTLQWLAEHPSVLVVVAIGNPVILQRVVGQVCELGNQFAQAVSPAAKISRLAELAPGVVIFPGAIVNTRARIGACATLNVGSTVSHDSVVGEYCNLNPGARLGGNVTLGDGCYIGMGACVIHGRTIGAWTTVGAGSAVVRDLPEHVTAVGSPARVIKRRADTFE